MTQTSMKFAEVALLVAALFFTLPYVPSNDVERLPLFPAGLLAIGLFAGSRFIRWRPAFIVAVAETLAFAIFVWGSNAVANLLYDL